LFAGKLADPEGTTGMSYRIESFGGAGTLSAGSNAGGTVINPNGTVASMFTLMQTPSGAASNISAVYWQAPNAAGTFKLMTVRLFDGTDYSVSTTDIFVTIDASNVAPTWSAVTVTLPSSASESGSLPVTYETLASLTSPSDADGDTVRFKVTGITTGTVVVNGTSYSGSPATPPSIGPGETLTWRPGVNPGTNLTAFSIMATDGTLDSAGAAVTVKGNVTGVNDAPTMTTSATLTGANRNQWFEIKFETLRSALNMNDAETSNSALTIKVEQRLAGQELKLGNSSDASPVGSSTTATAWSAASNSTITNGKSIWWLPPANVANTISAFTVSVLDAANVASGNIATVNVTVTGSNAAPTLTAGNLDRGTYAQGAPFAVSYAQLIGQFAPADTDSAVVSFVVSSITNATLKKGTTTMTAAAGTPVAANIISPDETILVIPSAAVGGATTLFTVKAWDGDTLSSGIGNIQAAFTAPNNNLVPVLSYVRDFTGAVKDTVYPFTYAALRSGGTPARSDAFDAEENISVPSLKFKVKTVYSTNGKLCAGTDGTCTATALVAGQLIDSDTNSSFNWKPEASLHGTAQTKAARRLTCTSK
ncbi:MAG: hypothetical protein EBR09_13355, partial [Proteobacteria bacterium]|nr:hypothetical protein [Pseudomonadota bacterium]